MAEPTGRELVDVAIARMNARIEERYLADAKRAAVAWGLMIQELGDAELAGVDVAIEIELERRGILDRAPRQVRRP